MDEHKQQAIKKRKICFTLLKPGSCLVAGTEVIIKFSFKMMRFTVKPVTVK
jgi:hypothetical protein